MKYGSGQTVLLGDQVLIERGATPGQVVNAIETDSQMKEWNIEEPGFMIKSAPFGLVFWPLESDDPVRFVSRGELA